MKIAFFCPDLNADYLKCIRVFRDLGADVRVFSFRRRDCPAAEVGLPLSLLGSVEHGRYLSRIPKMLAAAGRLRPHLAGYDCFYAFNWEMAALALLAARGATPRPVMVLQMLDIRSHMLGGGPVSRILRLGERWVLSRIDLLCLTSRAYLDHYYLPVQRFRDRPYFILENKIAGGRTDIIPSSGSRPESEAADLAIGYFGLIRCRKSCEILEETVSRGGGRFRLYLRGYALGDAPDLEEYAAGSPRINYGGRYRAPEELPEMFSRIDLLWIASPYADDRRRKTDWRWKRTNRFYQGCYFRQPMLAWKDTADGEVVEKFDLGLTLDPDSPRRAADDIIGISPADLNRWRSNLAKLPQGIYTYTDEHRRLYEKIRRMSREKQGFLPGQTRN